MKYILLFILASTVAFASCSNMDPAHYDTPKKKLAVERSYSLKMMHHPINQYRKIVRDNGDTVTLYIQDSVALDTVWFSAVPAMKAEDYPLNKWRAEHEQPQFVGWERSYEKHGYDASGDEALYSPTLEGFEALKDVELYSFWK